MARSRTTREVSWDGETSGGSDAEELDLTQALAGSSSKGKAKAVPDQGDDADDDELIRASNAKASLKASAKAVAKKKKSSHSAAGGGSFQALGLHPALLRALLLRGFTTPTPIQRAALPPILASPPRDVVGMARTGSGKTLTYLIPLVQRLGGQHSVKFGVRALILVPTRELALQVLKVGKDLAKGFTQGTKGEANGEEDERRSEGLRWGLIVGGDSMDEQFSMIASNPDVFVFAHQSVKLTALTLTYRLIATPGRLLHVAVEMNLDLRSVQYVVFDEADRLFELGFSVQLHETLSRLPPQRQTLLFSATLPKSLVEFAKAGLQNPKLVRLDSETKISKELQMAFFDVRPAEKESALMLLLSDVIRVPKDAPDSAKRKRDKHHDLAPHSTIVFAATKHHVEYLTALLRGAGYPVSQIYSSLDQVARTIELARFRAGETAVLVVTDLAARGIDVPVLGHVINYDFPPSSRAFVHRVGRTARAGRTGWAYSLVTKHELPYLMDLQLFLSRPLVSNPPSDPDYTDSLVLGSLPRERLDEEAEYVRQTLVGTDATVVALQGVVQRAQKMYERSQPKASAQAFKRAKELADSSLASKLASHPLLATAPAQEGGKVKSRDELMALVAGFKPTETVFEVGKKGNKVSVAAQIMRGRRKTMEKVVKKAKAADEGGPGEVAEEGHEVDGLDDAHPVPLDEAEEEDLADVFEMPSKKSRPTTFRDPELYLGYEQADAAAERGYSLHEQSFAKDAQSAAFDLGATDDAAYAPADRVTRPSQLRWDRQTKKFVRSDQKGADNKKLIRTESGAKLPASFRSGAFEEWKSKSRTRLPRVGEEELKGRQVADGRKYRHRAGIPNGDGDDKGKDKAPKKWVFGRTPDGKKKFLGPTHEVTRGGGSKARSSASGGPGQAGKGKAGLRTVHQIRKERELKDRRKKRSNQPSRKKSRR